MCIANHKNEEDKKKPSKKDWLKLKRYTHFLPPLNHNNKSFIRSYVRQHSNIVRHRFYPLIHYKIRASSFKRPIVDGIRQSLRVRKSKDREIYYANHLDAQVYAWYCRLLSDIMEDRYLDSPVGDSVIAYRAIPYSKNRNKCNIDLAKEVFDHIGSQQEDLTVICLDITKFFDNLNHSVLKREWQKLLDVGRLPNHHYSVFKSLTNFSYVEMSDILNEYKELKIPHISLLKQRSIGSFCKNAKEFRERIVANKLIKYNGFGTGKGIPQGTPISACLSNLYMYDFDRFALSLVNPDIGLYRRYSDDILIVCRPDEASSIESRLCKYISNHLDLVINPAKTQTITFSGLSSNSPTYVSFRDGKRVNKPLEYLGFQYDGISVTLKESGISKYYKQIKRELRRRSFYAKVAKRKNLRLGVQKYDEWIFRDGIYRRLSHLGSKRKKIEGKLFWGNYLTYVYNASHIFKEPKIRSQLRNHWKIIEKTIAKEERRNELIPTPSKRGYRPKPPSDPSTASPADS